MTTIRQEDLIQSVADALQYISYYHPLDYIEVIGAGKYELAQAAIVAAEERFLRGKFGEEFDAERHGLSPAPQPRKPDRLRRPPHPQTHGRRSCECPVCRPMRTE